METTEIVAQVDPVYHGFHVYKMERGKKRQYAWINVDTVWEVLGCKRTFADAKIGLESISRQPAHRLFATVRWSPTHS